jgi:hypothetical protein
LAGTLAVTRLAAGWYILGLDVDMGPYATRREAEEERRGVDRFLRYGHLPGFVTSESRSARGKALDDAHDPDP